MLSVIWNNVGGRSGVRKQLRDGGTDKAQSTNCSKEKEEKS
jgi:hypothetical protein